MYRKVKLNKWIAGTLVLTGFLLSCKKGDPLVNQPPETQLFIENIELTGEDRLNSTVRLSWFGSDPDGYVAYFEYSLDNQLWTKINKRDTVFKFDIGSGNDSVDVDFYVRSVDDTEERDPTPAYLSIPLKNSPPSISYDDKSFVADTLLAVTTFRWNASDPDGDQTLAAAYIKINDGDWAEIELDKPLISLVGKDPRTPGKQKALLYYNQDVNAAMEVDGWVVGDTNIIYLRSEDQAQRQSEVDTTHTFYIEPIRGDLMLISGQPESVSSVYTGMLDNIYPNYTHWDLYEDEFKRLPYFWQPTGSILLKQFDKVVFHSDETEVRNSVSSEEGVLLDMAIKAIEDYLNNEGKLMVSHTFPSKADITNIRGVLPIDTISQTRGQAILRNDSIVEAQFTGYPNLQSTNILAGLDPFFPTADAEVAYRARILKVGGWKGSDNVAAIRRNDNNQVTQWFWSIPFHQLDQEISNLQLTLNKIINEDFNW